MTTSVYLIHKGINKPITFKGLQGQYILYGGAILTADLLLFAIDLIAPLGLHLSGNHIYNQYIFIEDQSATIQRPELQRRRHQSLAQHSRANALAADAVNEFLNDSITGQRSLVNAHFNVFAWTTDPKEIQPLRNKISSAITRIGAIPHPETVGAPQIWYAGIPGNAADFPMNDSFDCFAEQAACFLIPETNYRSSISPFGIRLGDRIHGHPLHVDLSQPRPGMGRTGNRNKFVLGGSGSGKSFFTFWLPEGDIPDTEKKEKDFDIGNFLYHPILFPVVTIIIMETFISKMRKLPGIHKVILIEEAWKAIARQGMSEYIQYIFKTVRKFLGEAYRQKLQRSPAIHPGEYPAEPAAIKRPAGPNLHQIFIQHNLNQTL
jgi:hypothetical protein